MNGRAKTAIVAILLTVSSLTLCLLIPPSPLARQTPDTSVSATPLGTIGDITWSNMNPSVSPESRYWGLYVYDASTDSFILFGGAGSSYELLDSTWSYDHDTNTWQNKSPAEAPYAFIPAYAYDPIDEVTILYPSFNMTSMEDNETWAYDSSQNKWSNLHAANAPIYRYLCSAAYDSESDKLILFGGRCYVMDPPYEDVTVNETWSYDFTSNTWTNLSSERAPVPRVLPSLVYDSQSDRIIMFGGFTTDNAGNEVVLNDTWSYDYNTNTWTNMSPPQRPSDRVYPSATYDPISDRMLLFGGGAVVDGSMQVFLDDLWTYDYDANSWSEVSQLVKPSGRVLAVMAIDPLDRVMVLFGGAIIESETVVALGDTWAAQLGAPIPEFQTIILPTIGIIAIVAVLAATTRRRRATD